MTIRPTFQAQNPDISGYALGWSSCTAFAGAMAASFDRQVPKLMSGGAVRSRTGDTSGGTNLAQIDAAIRDGWGVDLDVRYRYPFTDFAARINAGMGAVLQGWYGPIADSRFDAGGGFRQNHAVAVLPGWVVMDPLADGRRAGIYKYHAEPYPQTLLRSFAGKLNVGGYGYNPLGAGLVYAAFTRDRVPPGAPAPVWQASVHPVAGAEGYPTYRYFGVYHVVNGVVTSADRTRTGGFSATCSAPRLYSFPGHASQSLVKLLDGSRQGIYIRSGYARIVA